ncbi:MAG TPA: Ppx/GppA phosphatase family protein [Kofleriaceae bacterium]|nr:Ppx/GppA phosphatase family protein [Kofleriaceae bacterium]
MVKEVMLGAIDAGSNAIRMSIVRASGPRDVALVEQERVAVRLGHRTFTEGQLDGKTIEAAVAAFGRFRKLFDLHGVTRYRAVATSAVRNASNREDLIDRLHRELAIELETIDGEEEARLVRRAVIEAMSGKAEPALIADLGGGSLEVTDRSQGGWNTSSMRIGTVRLMETFGLSGVISEDEAGLLRRYVATQLRASLAPELSGSSASPAVACGGNAEALAQLFGGDGDATPSFKLSALEDGLPGLLALDVDKRMAKLGVRQDRAEVMGIAAIVLAELGKQLGVKKFLAPGVGIREGILLDLAEDSAADLPVAREPAVLASARAFAARMGHTSTHGEQVRYLSRALFDELKEAHKLPDRLGLVLELAALLHDIGEVVHRRAHHKHTEYMILHGRIPGLESPEREMVAAVARAHRKSAPEGKKHSVYAALPSARQAEVRKLAALLRIADELDADHRQKIVKLRAEVKPKKVRLICEALINGTPVMPPALRKATSFQQEFDRELSAEIIKAEKPRRRSARAD